MMVEIAQARVAEYVQAGTNGATTDEQGRALEDLICYVFSQVPGVSITRRNEMNVFNTEEIDVALWNDVHPDGFFFLSNVVLVECKNWSHAVSSVEVNWFDTKLRSRGLDFGILIATNGITGEAEDLTAAHSIVAAALRERRRLIVIRRDELLALTDSTELVRLVKEGDQGHCCLGAAEEQKAAARVGARRPVQASLRLQGLD